MNDEQAARIARLSRRTTARRRHVARSGRIVASGLAASGFVAAVGSLADADATKEQAKLDADLAAQVPPAATVVTTAPPTTAAPIQAPVTTQVVVQTTETILPVGEDGLALPTDATTTTSVRSAPRVALGSEPIGRIEPAGGATTTSTTTT